MQKSDFWGVNKAIVEKKNCAVFFVVVVVVVVFLCEELREVQSNMRAQHLVNGRKAATQPTRLTENLKES